MKYQPVSFKDLVTAMCLVENGKSQVKRADAQEFLSKLGMIMVKDPAVIETLLAAGRRGWAKKKQP